MSAPQQQQPTVAAKPPKKKRRVFTWVIVGINLIFLIWMIAGVSAATSTPMNCGTMDQRTCEAAQGIGTTIGAGLVIMLWVAVDVILGILWLVTRKREPQVVYVQQAPPTTV